MLKSKVGECGMASYGAKLGHVAQSCKQSDKTSGSIKGADFLDRRNEY